MGLETATFISGLTETWPIATDTKSQGDDHLRLLKAVLKATFPNADKAFYLPTAESTSGTINLDATDMNNTIEVDSSGGNVTVNLPSTLATADKGWRVTVIKTSTDANAAIVTPSAGTILTKVGAVATVRVGILCEPATFFWNGSAWRCHKPGPMIGSTEDYNGGSVPPGYLAEDGTTYSNTTFAELFAVLASTTLKDKRGRATIGDGTGSGLTARVNGTTYGAESVALAAANIPSLGAISGNNSISVTSTISNIIKGPAPSTSLAVTGGGAGWSNGEPVTSGSVTSTNASQSITVTHTNGAQTNVAIMMPSIGVKKLIRAC